ncbi:hypothetical protein ACVJGD_001843 [Bradyrhizobium sp. USDA 10063]
MIIVQCRSGCTVNAAIPLPPYPPVYSPPAAAAARK